MKKRRGTSQSAVGSVGTGPRPPNGPKDQCTAVAVPEFKRHLGHYVWTVALRELLRLPQIAPEVKRGVIVLGGVVIAPFVIISYVWWLLTGRRAPTALGGWLSPPGSVHVNVFGKPPPEIWLESGGLKTH